LPPNPVVEGGHYTQYNLLTEKTSTDFVIKQIAIQSGMLYADAFEMHVKWEFRTTDARSN